MDVGVHLYIHTYKQKMLKDVGQNGTLPYNKFTDSNKILHSPIKIHQTLQVDLLVEGNMEKTVLYFNTQWKYEMLSQISFISFGYVKQPVL